LRRFFVSLLAAAGVGNATRLACSGLGAEGPGVEIWSVQTTKTGPGLIQQKYVIPRLKSKDASVSLSADGRYLVARSDESFLFLELFDDHAEVICSQEMREGYPIWPTTDIAADGSVAALTGRDRVTVLETRSARTLLEITRRLFESRRNAWVALSPNGRLLATSAWGRDSVRIYRVPQ